ncbi:NRAMP family divalent metal transporter [Candidatus Palauibacter sp.]|uniref:NRAMP family divalent metal transporter n=1 Tax=Candidatus Palauibacter sp. TaxID=3101350 RepID=UPI003B016AAC
MNYPIARRIPRAVLDAEADRLADLARAPAHRRLGGYVRLAGPGFMGAALTLGAGTLTASMLSGATFGYRTLWLIWLSAGLGLFMMAAMARFTCKGGFRVIQVQNRRHSWVIGSLMTALVGTAGVAVIFNFGQVALGTHLIESLAPFAGFSFPAEVNWVIYAAATTWLILSYGRRRGAGTRLVEAVMKGAIALMIVAFGAVLLVVGVDWAAAARGAFVPWLPGGGEGLDLFIASSAAAVGVMDWVFFHYAGLGRGWGRKHESLARFDLLGGLFLPFVIVNFLVIGVFAGTLFPQGIAPESAPELAAALMPLLGPTWSQILFYVGFLAVPVTTTVGMSLAGAMAIHEAFGWEPDTSSWRWKISALLPQIAFLAAWNARPVWLVIAIAAFLSLANNVVGWSMYLLLNDREVLGADRSRSYVWNLGILLQVTLLNAIAITYVFNRLGWW